LNERHIKELSSDLGVQCRVVAEKAIQSYARDILMTVPLADQIYCEWDQLRHGEDQPSHALLTRIAQRICSRELCAAWCSQDTEMRNRAFDNLRRYLTCSLQYTNSAQQLRDYADGFEDVLQQTLETLHILSSRKDYSGPDDPASFLKWAQTILIRQAHVSLARYQREETVSLDAQMELLAERYVATDGESDPGTYVLKQELQRTLGEAILSMRNQRYRLVLMYTYLADMNERELALHLGVQLQDIYLWRHRALKALRSKPEVMRVLRSLLE
jgi:RNA polymerase sigma factor (sigma-70 family)